MGKPRLHYLKQVAINTGADSYTAIKIMDCNNSRGKLSTNQKIEVK
jgi:hypothetical protein